MAQKRTILEAIHTGIKEDGTIVPLDTSEKLFDARSRAEERYMRMHGYILAEEAQKMDDKSKVV